MNRVCQNAAQPVLWLMAASWYKKGIIEQTIEKEQMSQKEYFWRITEINASESKALFV